MKRIAVLLGIFTLSGLLVGCGNDSRDYLVTQTVGLMKEASSATTGITDSVTKAVKKAEGDKNKLDLTEAAKATEPLKETGKKLQEMKQRTENLRNNITDAEREQNAEDHRGKIVAALTELTEAKDALQKALKGADDLNKKKTEELRVKIREAEGPFEAVARQQ
jgi:hypothetical protein